MAYVCNRQLARDRLSLMGEAAAQSDPRPLAPRQSILCRTLGTSGAVRMRCLEMRWPAHEQAAADRSFSGQAAALAGKMPMAGKTR